MAEENKRSVDGFLFMTEEDAALARKELEKVQKLEEKIDYKNVKMIKLVYDKTLDSKVFKTQVGLAFLRKLQVVLMQNATEDVKDIPVNKVYQVREQANPAKQQIEKAAVKPKKTEVQIQKEKKNISVFLNIMLLVLIFAMFYMTVNSKNPNILNYEKALQNKYVTWEEDLSQRETAIREKEKELLINNTP